MQIVRIRHQWSERAGFTLLRPEGAREYVLLHFHTPVEMAFGGRQQPALPGTVIVFSPRFPHRVDCHVPLLHDWIHITGDVAEAMAQYGLAPNTPYSGMSIPELSEQIAFLETEYFAKRSYWAELAELKLRELFIRIAHSASGESPSIHMQTETFERLREARAHMLSHPELPWSIRQLADEVALSPSRLHALYKSSFGVSPNLDLIWMRVEKAKNLLLQERSIRETAELLGYGSEYHFIRQFKQFTGVSPGKYRKRQDE